MESAEGVLVFSVRDQAADWLQYQADRFFDQDFRSDTLRIWDLPAWDRTLLTKMVPVDVRMDRMPAAERFAGTDVLCGGICRAEYDMAPSLGNFTAFLNSARHGPLKLSGPNRKIANLLYLKEKGELPLNNQNLNWAASMVKTFTGKNLREHYSRQELKKLSSVLLHRMFPRIRSGSSADDPTGHPAPAVKGKTLRAVPSIRPRASKRSPGI